MDVLGSAGASLRKTYAKAVFWLPQASFRWIMSTPDNQVIHIFNMWDADDLKWAQYRPGTVLMHPATSCATLRSCCTRAPSARSSASGAPAASCSPRCLTE